MSDELEKCATCRFYFETEAGNDLQRATVCRRYPPVGTAIPTSQGVAQLAFFPAIQSHHWCGEFIPNKIILQ